MPGGKGRESGPWGSRGLGTKSDVTDQCEVPLASGRDKNRLGSRWGALHSLRATTRIRR